MATEDNAGPETSQGFDLTSTPRPIPPQVEQVLPESEQNPPDKHVHVTMNIPAKHWTIDWLPIGINAALAVIGVVAICVYGAQLGVMRGQLVAMNKQLSEMQNQTNLAQQQLEGTMAAVLKVNTNVNFDRNTFQINLMNIGHVIARKVDVALQITKRTLPSEQPIGGAVPANFTISEIGLTQDRWTDREYPIQVSDTEKALIMDTKLTLRIEGTLNYNNGFEVVSQNICFSYFTYEVKDSTGRIISSGNNPQAPCDEFDVSLPGILKQKSEMLKSIYGQQKK